MNTALLVIDVQNDYFPNGRMELEGSMDASLRTRELIESFRNRNMPVIHVRHESVRPGAAFFLPGTAGAEFHENVKPDENEKVIVKNYPNSFRKTGLDDHLKKNRISRLVIAGMMTHMCVDATVRAAYDLGYECIVAADCCATKSMSIFQKRISAEDMQNSFLAALNGVFSKVMTKNEVMERLDS